ncbi:hypothetical protein [Aquimarina sp. I32.4]|uniref:hypothetical protein n=1 Tax=Aquimarina sp. I32.4 TaxID=2053903 RepID=UPI000CDE7F6D|nr:hypothetical protein [Aquimarina sp. I32.4]
MSKTTLGHHNIPLRKAKTALGHPKLPPFESLTMDYKGNLQITPIKHPRQKKTLRTIGAITLFVGGVVLGTQLDR